MICGATVGVRQQTAQTRKPGSFTNVQCSHCQETSAGGGAGPRESSLSALEFSAGPSSLSLSVSESASLDGSGGGDGVRCLFRRNVRDRTLTVGDAARDPTRDAARETV